ncbi:MAG TPA: hypothetical protein VGF38_06035 [Ktedonobacterales bacterium]|jgi:hypothetical protein
MGDEESGQHENQDHPAVRLLPNHQRTLAALLTQIAETIARYERWTNDRLEEHLTFARRPDDLTHGERQALHDKALELVREANRLAELFSLETQAMSVRASLAGAFTVLWSDIEDSGPKRLAGYGPVSLQVRTLLEPEIRRLAGLSLQMARLASGQTEEPETRPRAATASSEDNGDNG